MTYPKQLNAFGVTKILGADPLHADIDAVTKRLRKHFKERGPFSYDYFRRNVFALISRQRRLADLIDECGRTGRGAGRQPNIDLMMHTLDQYKGCSYRTFPVKPAIREVKDGLIVRVNCSLYVAEGNHFSFEIYQPSKTADFSEEQILFAASLYAESYLRDDYVNGLIRFWDFSWNDDKTGRVADAYSFDLSNKISKSLLDAALTVYVKAYDRLIAEGLPAEMFSGRRTYEDHQYDFWHG